MYSDADLMAHLADEGLVEKVEIAPCDVVDAAWAAFMAAQEGPADLDVQLAAYERYLVALDRHLNELRRARSRQASCGHRRR